MSINVLLPGEVETFLQTKHGTNHANYILAILGKYIQSHFVFKYIYDLSHYRISIYKTSFKQSRCKYYLKYCGVHAWLSQCAYCNYLCFTTIAVKMLSCCPEEYCRILFFCKMARLSKKNLM